MSALFIISDLHLHHSSVTPEPQANLTLVTSQHRFFYRGSASGAYATCAAYLASNLAGAFRERGLPVETSSTHEQLAVRRGNALLSINEGLGYAKLPDALANPSTFAGHVRAYVQACVAREAEALEADRAKGHELERYRSEVAKLKAQVADLTAQRDDYQAENARLRSDYGHSWAESGNKSYQVLALAGIDLGAGGLDAHVQALVDREKAGLAKLTAEIDRQCGPLSPHDKTPAIDRVVARLAQLEQADREQGKTLNEIWNACNVAGRPGSSKDVAEAVGAALRERDNYIDAQGERCSKQIGDLQRANNGLAQNVIDERAAREKFSGDWEAVCKILGFAPAVPRSFVLDAIGVRSQAHDQTIAQLLKAEKEIETIRGSAYYVHNNKAHWQLSRVPFLKASENRNTVDIRTQRLVDAYFELLNERSRTRPFDEPATVPAGEVLFLGTPPYKAIGDGRNARLLGVPADVVDQLYPNSESVESVSPMANAFHNLLRKHVVLVTLHAKQKTTIADMQEAARASAANLEQLQKEAHEAKAAPNSARLGKLRAEVDDAKAKHSKACVERDDVNRRMSALAVNHAKLREQTDEYKKTHPVATGDVGAQAQSTRRRHPTRAADGYMQIVHEWRRTDANGWHCVTQLVQDVAPNCKYDPNTTNKG